MHKYLPHSRRSPLALLALHVGVMSQFWEALGFGTPKGIAGLEMAVGMRVTECGTQDSCCLSPRHLLSPLATSTTTFSGTH